MESFGVQAAWAGREMTALREAYIFQTENTSKLRFLEGEKSHMLAKLALAFLRQVVQWGTVTGRLR